MISSNQNSLHFSTNSSTLDGFGDFLDSGKNDAEANLDGLGDFDMNFDDMEVVPPVKNNEEEERGDPSPMRLTPLAPAMDMHEDFGSSSGEEEVLEVGTF